MKLIHQINIAFGVLLLIILSITGFIIHYVLMDHFVGNQKQEMQSIGHTMQNQLSVQKLGENTDDMKVSLTATTRPLSIHPARVQAIISDDEGNIITDSIVSELTEASAIGNLSFAEASSDLIKLEEITQQGNGQYIVNTSSIPQGTLTLFTPISEIKKIEQALLERFLLILGAAGILLYLASLFITRKLIHPLMKLKEELKKVKTRQFSDVKLIHASGEIGVVAQAVHELAIEMDRYHRAQKHFFQNASHELKTPLMSIAGYAEAIKDGIFAGEQATKGLDIIQSESGRLSKIVTEMTLLAKLDSEESNYHPTKVNISDIVTETKERVNPLLLAKNIKLHITYQDKLADKLTVMADPDKLLQALINVVSNAVRYAKHNIWLELQWNNNRVQVFVRDDGAGISEALLPQLFHRFVKGKDGDTGLGLAISRAIIERCGGVIAASNVQEGGALISIELPITAAY